MDHSHRSQPLLQSHPCSPCSEHLLLGVLGLYQERKVFDQQEEMSRTHRTSQTSAFRAKTAPTWSVAYTPRKQMRNRSKGAAQKNPTAPLLGSYHSAVEQNWQWKGIKGPNHQGNWTIPALGDSQPAWEEWSGEGPCWGQGLVGFPLPCLITREWTSTVNMDWETARKKKISICKLTEKLFMRTCYISAQSLLHYAMAFCVCFFFFLH